MAAPDSKDSLRKDDTQLDPWLRERAEKWRQRQAAGYRSLANDPDLDVRFGNEGNATAVELADLGNSDENSAEGREIAAYHDALAVRTRYHASAVHRNHRPAEQLAAGLFDSLEEVRLEALGGRYRLGVRANLQHCYEAKMLEFGQMSRVEEVTGTDQDQESHWVQSVRQAGRTHAFAGNTPQALAGLAPELPDAVEEQLATFLAEAAYEDQENYAEHAATIAEELARTLIDSAAMIDAANPPPDGDGDDASGDDQPAPEAASGEDALQDQLESMAESMNAEGDAGDPAEDQADMAFNDDDAHGDSDDFADIFLPPRPEGQQKGQANAYNVFTTEFDCETLATDLCQPEETIELRDRLDERVQPFLPVVTRLANRLQRRLMARQQLRWETDLEEGQLNPARLTRLVLSPYDPRCFRRASEAPYKDTVVTLLIDNSGSMRGRPIALAAMCAEVISRTLEQCGVRCEVLGFTTSAWKGGKARDRWIEKGKPRNPGRLNDLLHVVYKNANETWRKARPRLGVMLREGLLKENIDGEALLWACARLRRYPADRKILMVISDGAPVDDTTLSVNGSQFLESHLHTVIRGIESAREIELCAIGIGHAVDRYYAKAVTVPDAEQLGSVLIEQLADLFLQKPTSG